MLHEKTFGEGARNLPHGATGISSTTSSLPIMTRECVGPTQSTIKIISLHEREGKQRTKYEEVIVQPPKLPLQCRTAKNGSFKAPTFSRA